MARLRRLTFGRVNRPVEESLLQQQPFSAECVRLAELGVARYTADELEWVAADIHIDDSGVLVGTLGQQRDDVHLSLPPGENSWVKAVQQTVSGASRMRVVPFAIATGDDERWLAIAARGLKPLSFAFGLELAVNATLLADDPAHIRWQVALLTSKRKVREWLAEQQGEARITLLRRTVDHHNPRRAISEEHAELLSLNAGEKEELFKPDRGESLELLDMDDQLRDDVRWVLEGVDQGWASIRFEATMADGSKRRFTQERGNAEIFVSDFGVDLEAGMAAASVAVRGYGESESAGAA